MPPQDNFSARRLFIGVRGGLSFDPRSRIHAPAGHQWTPKKGRPQAEAAQLSVRRSNQTARIATILWLRSTMMISSPTTKYQNPRHCGWMSTMTDGTSTTRTLVGTTVPTLIEKLTLLARGTLPPAKTVCLVLVPLALARGLIALLLSLATLLGVTLLATILLHPLIMLTLGRLARGLALLPALRLALLLVLRALLRWPLHVMPALSLAARSRL